MTLYKTLKHHRMVALGPALGAGVCWITWLSLMVVEIGFIYRPSWKAEGLYALAWVFYLGFVTIITVARVAMREHYGINGNPVEDFFAVLFMYPSVMIQLETVYKKGGLSPLMPDNRHAHQPTSYVVENRAVDNGERETVA